MLSLVVYSSRPDMGQYRDEWERHRQQENYRCAFAGGRKGAYAHDQGYRVTAVMGNEASGLGLLWCAEHTAHTHALQEDSIKRPGTAD